MENEIIIQKTNINMGFKTLIEFEYSKDELLKLGFKIEDIIKILKIIKRNRIEKVIKNHSYVGFRKWEYSCLKIGDYYVRGIQFINNFKKMIFEVPYIGNRIGGPIISLENCKYKEKVISDNILYNDSIILNHIRKTFRNNYFKCEFFKNYNKWVIINELLKYSIIEPFFGKSKENISEEIISCDVLLDIDNNNKNIYIKRIIINKSRFNEFYILIKCGNIEKHMLIATNAKKINFKKNIRDDYMYCDYIY